MISGPCSEGWNVSRCTDWLRVRGHVLLPFLSGWIIRHSPVCDMQYSEKQLEYFYSWFLFSFICDCLCPPEECWSSVCLLLAQVEPYNTTGKPKAVIFLLSASSSGTCILWFSCQTARTHLLVAPCVHLSGLSELCHIWVNHFHRQPPLFFSSWSLWVIVVILLKGATRSLTLFWHCIID